MGDKRDAAVGGHDQAEADDAQVGPFLLGVASLGYRGLVVGRGDLGGEIGHVEHEPGQVDVEGLDHTGDDAALDLFQLGLADGPIASQKRRWSRAPAGRASHRSAAVLAHQSEKASLEQGSVTRLSAAKAM